jgi:hypothetical protein
VADIYPSSRSSYQLLRFPQCWTQRCPFPRESSKCGRLRARKEWQRVRWLGTNPRTEARTRDEETSGDASPLSQNFNTAVWARSSSFLAAFFCFRLVDSTTQSRPTFASQEQPPTPLGSADALRVINESAVWSLGRTEKSGSARQELRRHKLNRRRPDFCPLILCPPWLRHFERQLHTTVLSHKLRQTGVYWKTEAICDALMFTKPRFDPQLRIPSSSPENVDILGASRDELED